MINDQEWVISPNTLLVLRYRIIELERYWSDSILSAQTDDSTVQRDQDGAIYRARDVSIASEERFVHVLERKTSLDPTKRADILRKCQREADLLFSLHHPSIPNFLDYFTPEDRAYIITDYIEGTDLQARANSVMFSNAHETDIIRWIIKLCDAIGYLHEQDPPLLFRSLEAQKVVVDDTGNLCLTDLSSVSIYQESFRGTKTGVHGFAAPEQYRGEHLRQSDIYSIGAVFHFLLTAHASHQSGLNHPAIQGGSDSPPHIREVLERIAYKASAFNPELRYQTVREMQEDLEALV
jgi:serine/threonine-protein kinase